MDMLDSLCKIFLLIWALCLRTFSVVNWENNAVPINCISIALRKIFFSGKHESCTTMSKDECCVLVSLHRLWFNDPKFNFNSFFNLNIDAFLSNLLFIYIPTIPSGHLVSDCSRYLLSSFSNIFNCELRNIGVIFETCLDSIVICFTSWLHFSF